ncbi:unnamed protein product [Schistosoma rodhaini]|uniref:Uncharacterized protein n=2 Tax=Schistosoma rodhaini TaxID=6188 RepID=A0A183QXJ8_9TREM|nr:unnamed protein product [Schistosoma rodhaini]
MNKFPTWNILFITTLIVYCLLISLTNAWKIGKIEIPNDNEDVRMESEEEIEPTLRQRRKWISQLYHGDLPWIHGLNRAAVNQRLYNTIRRERRFFCNPMGCV